MVCHKDRDSVLPAELWAESRYSIEGERWYAVGDGAGGLTVDSIEPPTVEREDRQDEGAELQVALIRVLREAGGPLNQSQVVDSVPGRRHMKVDGLNRMANDPEMPVHRETEGRGRPMIYTYVEPAPDPLDL